MGRAFRLLLISPSWSMHACVVDGWKRGGFGEMVAGGWQEYMKERISTREA